MTGRDVFLLEAKLKAVLDRCEKSGHGPLEKEIGYAQVAAALAQVRQAILLDNIYFLLEKQSPTEENNEA